MRRETSEGACATAEPSSLRADEERPPEQQSNAQQCERPPELQREQLHEELQRKPSHDLLCAQQGQQRVSSRDQQQRERNAQPSGQEEAHAQCGQDQCRQSEMPPCSSGQASVEEFPGDCGDHGGPQKIGVAGDTLLRSALPVPPLLRSALPLPRAQVNSASHCSDDVAQRPCGELLSVAPPIAESAPVRQTLLPVVSRVIIVGVMRGDDLCGACVGRRLECTPSLTARPSFGRAEFVIGNPQALQDRRCFLHEDLAVQFHADRLQDISLSSYEACSAKVLNARLGPKGSGMAADFIVELRTTTSAAGVSLIVEDCI